MKQKKKEEKTTIEEEKKIGESIRFLVSASLLIISPYERVEANDLLYI